MKKNGFFISIEGTDGVGKSTQTQLLVSWLKKKDRSVLVTREPGGSPLAEKIRMILLSPKSKMGNLTELFLYQAARAEHVEKIIAPALRAGRIVICDRFIDATMAYQGFARGMNTQTIHTLNQISTTGVFPDLTLWLDYPVKIGLRKALKRTPSKKGDRIEKEGILFQIKVQKGYSWAHKKNPGRIIRIPVQEKIFETQALIRSTIEKKLKI